MKQLASQLLSIGVLTPLAGLLTNSHAAQVVCEQAVDAVEEQRGRPKTANRSARAAFKAPARDGEEAGSAAARGDAEGRGALDCTLPCMACLRNPCMGGCSVTCVGAGPRPKRLLQRKEASASRSLERRGLRRTKRPAAPRSWSPQDNSDY